MSSFRMSLKDPECNTAFMCFYDAERVLSAIAKFPVHFLGEGKARGKIVRLLREREGKGRKGDGGEKIGIHKNSSKMQHFWHYGDAHWGYNSESYIIESYFHEQNLPRSEYASISRH